MSIALVVNGNTYNYPEVGDANWGQEATDWASAVTSGMLQKAGGLFQLLAEVDLGPNFGLKSIVYKSRTANISSVGALQLANTDSIGWRNNANSANLLLSVTTGDLLQYGGSNVLIAGLASIVNADISATAAIAFSKMAAMSTSKVPVSDGSGFLVASVVTTTELGNLVGTTSAIQTQLNTKITASSTDTLTNKTFDADGTGNSISNIENADIKAGAAIAYSKLASLTSAHILVGSAGNVATDVALSGDISLTNAGVSAYAGTVPLNKGGTGQTTKAPAFDALSPMTTGGDLIYGGASGTGTRLANGSSGQFLKSNGTTSAPSWASPGSKTIYLSASSGAFVGGAGAGPTDVTNLTISVTTLGNPILAILVPDGSANNSSVGFEPGAYGNLYLNRAGSVVANSYLEIVNTPNAAYWAPGSIVFYDAPAAGTYTYKIQYSNNVSNIDVFWCKLLVYEL